MALDLYRKFVQAPNLRRRSADEECFIENSTLKKFIEAHEDVLIIVDFFKTPKTLREALDAFDGLELEDLQVLVDSVIIVAEDEVSLLSQPVVYTTGAPIGTMITNPVATVDPHIADSPQRDRWAIIGMPTDIAGQRAGARHGPGEIRRSFQYFEIEDQLEETQEIHRRWGVNKPSTEFLEFDYRRKYDLRNHLVCDFGDINVLPGQQIAGARLMRVLAEARSHGFTPIVLGGDHSVTRYCLEAIPEEVEAFGVIHFDAHHDLAGGYPATQLTHANPFVHALESQRLTCLYQLGLRLPQRVAKGESLMHEPRVSYRSSRELLRAAPEEVFAHLDPSICYYLTFDVDCLAPYECPETGTPAAGGLDLYCALDLVDHLSRNFNIIGADFVEVTIGLGTYNVAANAIARLLLQTLLSRTPFEVLDGYVFRRDAL